MQILRSFEESSQGTYGDLLSWRRSSSKIKVGLLLFGYFEYWRMFPEELRQRVEEDLRAVEARLRKQYDIISTDLVDTLDSADISGRILKESGVDALILVMGTYVPDYISMHTLNYVRDVPLLIFSAQHMDNINAGGTRIDHARGSSMVSTAQLTATFRKIHRKYQVVVGSVESEEAYRKIADFLNAIQAIHDVREANIGVVGNVFRGMYDVELSKTFLKGVFDVNVIYMQNAHLTEMWEATAEKEVQETANRLMNRFKMRTVTEFDVLRACRLAVAMRKLVERYRLDALCVLDQHYLQRLFRTTARIGASLLMEEQNVQVSCEGDLGGIVVSMLMQSLSKTNPIQGEWCQYDETLNACLIGGHGMADPRLARSEQDVVLTRTPEEWGMDGAGLNYEFIVKPGACTISSLLETGSNYSMLISPVESIDHEVLHHDELHAIVRVRPPVKEYLERLFQFGVTQHCILCYTDVSEMLKIVADQLGLETLVI